MKPPLSLMDELLELDPGFADAVDRCPAFPGFPLSEELERTPFQFLAHTVLYQRGSVAGAVATYRRVSDLLVPPHFPDPEELLWLPDEDLLRAGVWTNKLETLRGLARACLDGTLDPSSLAGLSDEEVIRSLTRVRGIGPWTAKMYLIFRLGRLDVMAEDDIGLRRGLQSLIGSPSRPPPSELLARSQAWRPLRSVASWYLWRYDDLHSSAPATRPRPRPQRA